MARINPTRIEELDAKFPGVRPKVDAALDRHATLDEISDLILEISGEELPEKTISNYKQRRWLPEVQRIRDVTERAAAINEAYRRFGVGMIAESVALQKLDEIAPDKLLRESRERERLEIERGKLEVAKQEAETARREVELKLAQFERERKRVNEIVEGGEAQRDPADALRRIREVYGLSGSGEAPALPANVG